MRGRGDPDRGGIAAPVERVWLHEEEERGAEMGERRGLARVWLRAARCGLVVFSLRNKGLRIVSFDDIDRLIGRSVGEISWIFDWLKRG
jgi:hypothetical protein